MDSDQEMSIEKRLAQTMIDLNKGHLYVNIHQRRDDLMKAIHIIKQKIEFYAKQNYILNEFKGKAELVNNKINEMSEIDVQQIFDEIGKQNDTKEVSIQTERVAPRSTFHGKATKYKDSIQLAYNLSSKEKLLRKKLNDLKLATNYRGPNYLLVKISEYEDLKSKAVDFTEGNEFDAHSGITSLYNEHHHEHHSISDDSAFAPNDLVTPLSIETQSQPNPETVLSTPTCVGSSSISNSGGVFEESDDEGVQLLLSMKRNVFSCKCGEYLNSITDWSEHQKICSRSTDKTIGEQCQLCKKTFLTCVALNIHSTKKHNKKKMRTDSIMHCPCGQSFTAKWRQNCVHKLNSHGRHCKAFKAREIQCSICKKGFIERKSLEYHGLKAHKLAVPVNS